MVVRIPDWCLPQYRFRCFINTEGYPVAISQYHHDQVFEGIAGHPEAVLDDLLPALRELTGRFKAVMHRFNTMAEAPSTSVIAVYVMHFLGLLMVIRIVVHLHTSAC